MSSIIILLVSLVAFIVAYLVYGKWLAKKWGVDDSRPTPAHTLRDDVDYSPAKAPVLLGHHFASIAGAGPINGPIQAAVFGWVPVLLWVVIGGIFFGAVHDFASLFASVRHEGKSIGHVIEVNIGQRGKKLFLVFGWLTLILVIAAFASIVAGTFTVPGEFALGFMDTTADLGDATTANGSVATASLLFILLAIVFGFFVYRRKAPLLISSVIGVVLLCACVYVGMCFPIVGISSNVWLIVIAVYIIIACVTPVWILLQPRDYLNSFLLYGMMLLAVVGVLFSNPTMQLDAFTSFNVGADVAKTAANSITGPLFPVLFITVACGAISGFHSLVGSGTTSKQLDREKDIKLIGYGGMLIECFLAVLAIIAVGSFATGAAASMTPAVVFAQGIANFFGVLGLQATGVNAIYTVLTLAVSAFALTSLDTASRMARFLFQEFFTKENENVKSITGIRKVLINPWVATIISVGFGIILAFGGYAKIWPLFGAANQLLAGLALLACCVWLGNIGKNNKMFYIPMAFMIVATITSLVITLVTKISGLGATTDMAGSVLQIFFSAILVVLAVVLVFEGVKKLVSIKGQRKDTAA